MCQTIQYRIYLLSIFYINTCIVGSQSNSTVFSSRFNSYITANDISRYFFVVFINDSCVATVVINSNATCIFNVTAIANEVANKASFACFTIFPDSTIGKAKKHFAASAVTIPVAAFAIDVYIHRTTGIASPMCTVFNPKVYRAKLARSYTITIVISVFAMPVGIFTSKTYTDLAFSTHTAISNEIASNGSFTVTCTNDITIFIFRNIDIYNAIVLAYKFTIRTNCCPSTIFSFNVTATNFNAGCNCADSFICTIIFICYYIYHTIDDDFRFNTICTIHSLDDSTIIYI